MQRQIASLDDQLKTLQQSIAFIGHNSAPYGEDDRREIEEALDTLKSQPPEVENAVQSIEAARSLWSNAKKISAYVARQSDLLVTEMIKSAGSELGKLVARLSFLTLLANQLVALSNRVLEWLKANGFNLEF